MAKAKRLLAWVFFYCILAVVYCVAQVRAAYFQIRKKVFR